MGACLLLSGPGQAASSSAVLVDEIRDSLPKYDPTPQPAPSAGQKRPGPGSSAARRRLQPGAAAPTPPATETAKAEPVVTMPRYMVTGRPDKAAPLPRLMVRPPKGHDDGKDHTFETPQARDERLKKKHHVLTAEEARHAEDIEHNAIELGAIAEALDAPPTSKADADEKKRLREAYYSTFLTRPK